MRSMPLTRFFPAHPDTVKNPSLTGRATSIVNAARPPRTSAPGPAFPTLDTDVGSPYPRLSPPVAGRVGHDRVRRRLPAACPRHDHTGGVGAGTHPGQDAPRPCASAPDRTRHDWRAACPPAAGEP